MVMCGMSSMCTVVERKSRTGITTREEQNGNNNPGIAGMINNPGIAGMINTPGITTVEE